MTFAFITLSILNFIAELVEFTYDLGKASAPYIKMAVAFVITTAILAYENRHKVEEFRHSISRAFSYEYQPSTPVLKAPRYIKFRRPANTMVMA